MIDRMIIHIKQGSIQGKLVYLPLPPPLSPIPYELLIFKKYNKTKHKK